MQGGRYKTTHKGRYIQYKHNRVEILNVWF